MKHLILFQIKYRLGTKKLIYSPGTIGVSIKIKDILVEGYIFSFCIINTIRKVFKLHAR